MARKQKKPVEPQQLLAGHHAESRARVRPGPESSVVDRVAWCRHLMVAWEWYGASTRRELSALWGVAESTVMNYSAEAHRSIQRSPEELESERLVHASNAERIMLDAYSRASNITGLPDYSAALKANEQAAAFKGLELKAKVELTGKDGGPIETKSGYDDILTKLARIASDAAKLAEPTDVAETLPTDVKPVEP